MKREHHKLIRMANSVSSLEELDALASAMRRSRLGFHALEQGYMNPRFFIILGYFHYYAAAQGTHSADWMLLEADWTTGGIMLEFPPKMYETQAGAKTAVHNLRKTEKGTIRIVRVTETHTVVWELFREQKGP